MRTRTRLLILGMVLVGVIGYGIFVSSGYGGARDVAAFEAEMRQSLPLGSSREQVDERFRAVGVGRRYVPAERTIYAITPTVRRNLFTFENVQILAHFDDMDHLTALEFQPALSGRQ